MAVKVDEEEEATAWEKAAKHLGKGNTDEEDEWNVVLPPAKQAVQAVLNSHPMVVLDLVLICFYMWLVILQTNAGADDAEEEDGWILPTMFIMNIHHIAQCGLRMWIAQPRFWFRHHANIADFTACSLDLVFNILDLCGIKGERFMAFVRLFRFAQGVGTVGHKCGHDELTLMMKGLSSALKSTFWGALCAMILIIGWSIMATQVLHPIVQELVGQGEFASCDKCPDAFGSVFRSFLTFVQIYVAGDSWGKLSITIINARPLTGLLFGAAMVSIQWIILNMVLAAVVDASTQARRGTEHDMAERKQFEAKKAKKEFLKLCEKLDTCKDGQLDLEELLHGASENQDFKDTLATMDVKGDDLQVVFNIMDSDRSGSIDYEEFVDQLFTMKNKNHITMLCIIQHHVSEIKKKLFEEMENAHIQRANIQTELHRTNSERVFSERQLSGSSCEAGGWDKTTTTAPTAAPTTAATAPTTNSANNSASNSANNSANNTNTAPMPDADANYLCKGDISKHATWMQCQIGRDIALDAMPKLDYGVQLQELKLTMLREVQDTQSKHDTCISMLKELHNRFSSPFAFSASASLEVRGMASSNEGQSSAMIRTRSPAGFDVPYTAFEREEGCLGGVPQLTSLAARSQCCAVKIANPIAVKRPDVLSLVG